MNPYFRQSARELLKNSYFDSIRNVQNERHCDTKLQFDVDNDDVYSYEDTNSTKYDRNDYLEMILGVVRENNVTNDVLYHKQSQ